MKSILFIFLALFTTFGYASEILDSNCLDDQSKSKIAFEQLKRLDDGSVWIKGVHLVDGKSLLRIKASEVNKKRICQSLGYRAVEGSRIEFDRTSIVVGINKDLKVTKDKKPETKFIQNITCR
jgi:hypothetical protein